MRGLLAHIGKPELLPLIFDDLAEIHRVSGVADDAPPAAGDGDGAAGGGRAFRALRFAPVPAWRALQALRRASVTDKLGR
ncbi:MAG: hypothetical protein ABI134_31045 [Byssovorax sp.]